MNAPLAAVVVAVLVASGCGDGSPPPPGDDAAPTPTEASGNTERTVGVYSAVVRRLVTVDHTFGGGPTPFERTFIVDGVVEDAADEMTGENDVGSRFSAEVEQGITDALGDLPPVEFVRDPDDVVVGKKQCPRVRGNGVLISLGPIDGDGDRVEVANELYIACLGGQWLTYVVERSGDEWEVTGTTGPVAIA